MGEQVAAGSMRMKKRKLFRYKMYLENRILRSNTKDKTSRKCRKVSAKLTKPYDKATSAKADVVILKECLVN